MLKKRKVERLAQEDGNDSGASLLDRGSPQKTAELIKLETEVKRLTFERDSAKKLVELERSDIENKLRQRRHEEEVSLRFFLSVMKSVYSVWLRRTTWFSGSWQVSIEFS